MQRVNPDTMAPATGFSHAVIGSGTTVFLAGQTAMNPDGSIIDGDIVEQFDKALSNILAALKAAGGTPDQLASLTVYLVDMQAYKDRGRDIGKVWKKLVGRSYPAMAAVGVSRLWDTEALVEITGFACI